MGKHAGLGTDCQISQTAPEAFPYWVRPWAAVPIVMAPKKGLPAFATTYQASVNGLGGNINKRTLGISGVILPQGVVSSLIT